MKDMIFGERQRQRTLGMVVPSAKICKPRPTVNSRGASAVWATAEGFDVQHNKGLKLKPSFGFVGSGAFGGRILVVLMSLALLGATPTVREFDLDIVARRVDGGTSTLRVKRGDTVMLRWRTDEVVVLHLHGYDIRERVSPAAATTTRFEARVAGRFAITAHGFGAGADHRSHSKKHREITLIYLEVLPE